MKRFLSVCNLRRILKYVAKGNADERVIARLQSELDKSGRWGNNTPWWMCYSAWLKIRILDSFDHHMASKERTAMIIDGRPRLEYLLRLSIKEAD
jgi:hypothetical protein